MKVLCKNTWKKRIGSILLCWCILITNVQIPAYVSAEESETVQALEDTEVDEGIQKLEEEISISEAPSLDLSVPETSAPETTVSQPETSAPAETQLPDLTVSELETQSPTASETELKNPAETQPIPETPIIDATERMTEGSLEETECETEKVIEVTEAETEESETESETEDRAAQWDVQNGAYVITSLEELQWYGQNGAGKNAYLANDLRIENGSGADTAWQPIEISGNAVFDGKDHTIEFYLTSCNAEANTEQVGLFAADNCTIQNLILKGSVICNVCKGDEESGYGYVGAVSGTGFGVTFRNILSYINVINQSTAPTGGMIGYLGQQGSGKTVIDNCAVYADVCGKDAAGGLAGSDSGENWSWKLSNSIFYGNISGAEGKTGALIGSHETEDWDGMEIGNCYYLENLQSIGVAENQEAIDGFAENSIAQNSAKSAEQFASGEITSLLNGGITDGSQRWYQTCGMGLPVFEGETVYAHLVGEQTVYTNSATPLENETEATENESEEAQTEAATESESEEAATEQEKEKLTAESVKAMIDALPEASELETLDEETLDQAYLDAQKAWDAYEKLAEEQQALLSEEKQKLDGVLEYFNDPIPTTISDSNGPGYGDYGYVFTGYFSAGYNLWITAGTNGGTAIYYREGNTATGTIKYLNASGAAGDDLSEVSVAGAAGGSSTNLSYNIYMDGGKIKNIYCSASANQGTVNVIITGGIVTNSIYTLAMNTGINKNGNRHVFSTVDVPISTYSISFQGYLKKSGSQWIGYNNPVIPSGYTMELNAGDTLTVPDGKTLTNNGTIKNHGATISGDWTFKNNGTVTCSTHSYRSSGTPCSDGEDHHCYNCYFHEDVLDTAHPQDCTFDDYGFCTVCDGYETPGYDWPYYESYCITLPGHLFWLAEKVNASKNNSDISAVLRSDINLNADGKNRTWVSIGKTSATPYSGAFYGMGYSISNLKQDITENGCYGLFGYVVDGGISNFSISGEVTMNCAEIKYGVIGEMTADKYDSTVENVHSSVNVKVLDSEMKRYIGGIVGAISTNNCNIERCSFSGTIAFNNSKVDCGGGIVGYTNYGKTVYIKDCLFDGTISSDNSDSGQIGGIFGYYRGNYLRVQNCLSVGTIDTAGTSSVGAVGGKYLAESSLPITSQYCYNNYFNCGSLPAFSTNLASQSGYSDSVARQATVKELAHGGICWLLNGKTSNSSNVWKQTIGTNTYPGFSGNIVYGIEGEEAAYGRNDTQTITQVSDYYEIYTPIQLIIFQELVDVGNRSAKGKLMADIDMSGYSWTPICITGLYYSADYTSGTNYPDNGYEGVFEGNGHVIRNLTVNGNSETKETYGLFGTSSGTVQNLGIENFTFNLNGASDIRTGAIVGQNLGGTIQNCYAVNVTINSSSYVRGGIAGCNYAGTIQNCHTYSFTVSSTNGRYGGIVGDNRADGSPEDRQGTLKNCYTTASALLGSQTGVETDCVAGVSNDRFASGEITWLLNESKVWNVRWKQNIGTDKYPNFSGQTVYISGQDYESGEAPELKDGIYYIYNKKQLMEFAQLVNSGNTGVTGILMADIDISDVSNFAIGNTESMPFTGIFDGNGCALTIGLSGKTTVAPFAYVKAATIQNLIVDGTITITGKFAAGLIGQTVANGGTVTISQCLSRVTINSSVEGDGTHGGLVGVANSGSPCTITNCGFVGTMNGSSTYACGGMVGWANAAVTITNSYVAGQFNINTKSGMTFGRSNDNWYTLTNCYYLTALDGTQSATQKSADAFQSGEVTYLLNNEQADGVWKQTINTHTSGTDTSATSDYPIFKGLPVYQMDSSIEKGYVNYAPPEKDSSGVYEIKNADNLMAFAQYVNQGSYNADGKVTADISMSAYENQWIPIARTEMGNEVDYGYTGTFDGNGHTISDISFGTTTAMCSNGLFGTVYKDGVVKHIGVTNLTFDDNTYDHRAAGIAGQLMYGGLIEDCFVTDSTIKASSRVVGGIAAMNLGTIQNCYTKNLTLAAYPSRYGGICGDYKGNSYSNNENGKVINCYTDYAAIGSTASGNAGTSKDSECGVTEERFASGEITYLLNGKTDKDIVWFQNVDTDTDKDAYPQFSGEAVHYGQQYCGKNAPKLYSNDDLVEVHDPKYNDDGFCTHEFTDGTVCDAYQPCTGEGTSDSPYQISNAGQLYWFAAVVNTGYQAVEQNLAPYGELTNDIKVNSNVLNEDGTRNTDDVDSFRVWTPIGRDEKQFKGKFNGNNHTVSGLYYDDADKNDTGFFGSCLGYVSGLILNDIYFHGNSAVGGIAGYMRENTIRDCGVDHALIVGEGDNAGGIVGTAERGGTLSHCYSGATVHGNIQVGGVAGGVFGNTVENCCQYGSVTGKTDVGSLAGIAQGRAMSMKYYSMSITYCHSYLVTDLPMVGEYIKSETWQYSTTIHHCYYLSDTETANEDGTTGKTAGQFQSGEVAWLLNKGTVGDSGTGTTDGTQIWYQTLDSDAYPVFSGETVYHGYQSCLSEDAEYANSPLNPDKSHAYTLEPYFSWSIDYKTCKAIFLCSVDAVHETYETACEMSYDYTNPNETVYTASVTMNGTTYTDTRTAENTVLSVAVSWEEMEFDYTPGKWDTEEHKYEVGNWSPTRENGNVLTVTNNGTVKLDISASYEAVEESVNGTVTVNDTDTNTFLLVPEQSQTLSLALDGEMKEKAKHQQVGTIVLSLKENILDLTAVEVDQYTAAIADYMKDGSAILTLRLGRETLTKEMGTAIAAGITEAGVTGCKLTLLDAVTIEAEAFQNCENLREIYLQNAVTVQSSAFEGCSNLKKAYCPEIETVGAMDQLKRKGYAFKNCIALEEIILPKATVIEQAAFIYCSALKYVELPETVTIGNAAFYNCSALENLYLPKTTFIDESAFTGCTGLKNVIAPLVTTAGSWVFLATVALQQVHMPELVTLGVSAFDTTRALKTIHLPKVTALKAKVFYDSALVSAVFPSVTSLGKEAFVSCRNLKTLTFCSVITSVNTEGTGWLGDDLSAVGNINLTLHKDQATSTDYPADLEAKTFGGYTFKSIQN